MAGDEKLSVWNQADNDYMESLAKKELFNYIEAKPEEKSKFLLRIVNDEKLIRYEQLIAAFEFEKAMTNLLRSLSELIDQNPKYQFDPSRASANQRAKHPRRSDSDSSEPAVFVVRIVDWIKSQQHESQMKP